MDCCPVPVPLANASPVRPVPCVPLSDVLCSACPEVCPWHDSIPRRVPSTPTRRTDPSPRTCTICGQWIASRRTMKLHFQQSHEDMFDSIANQ